MPAPPAAQLEPAAPMRAEQANQVSPTPAGQLEPAPPQRAGKRQAVAGQPADQRQAAQASLVAPSTPLRPEWGAPWPDAIDLSAVDAIAGPIGLAVSGGGDSVALAVLLRQARPERRFRILTVNHGLRPEASAEVAAVVALGARLGLPVSVLHAGPPAPTGLEAWARQQRTALFAAACAQHGLAAVALGHTVEDQAETVLMRLARGGGLKGLGAMRPVSARDGLTLVRPLLAVRRDDLRAALTARGIGWCEDPHNADPRFERVRMRSAMAGLREVGIDPDALARTAHRLQKADAALEAIAASVLAAHLKVRRAALYQLPCAALVGLADEVRERVLSRLLACAGGAPAAPRNAALATLAAELGRPLRRTLCRAVVESDGTTLTLFREYRGIHPLVLRAGQSGVFDRRFQVAARAPVTVAAAGPALAARLPQLLPRRALAAVPVLIVGGDVVAAPTLGVHRRLLGDPLAAVELLCDEARSATLSRRAD